MSAPRKVRRRRRREPASAARLLPRIPATASDMGHADLGAAWRELGPRAAGAMPIRVSRNGVVTLACADAVRAQQIQADADHLLEELSRIAGVSITRLDTVIADHALELPEFAARPAEPVSPAAQRAAEHVAEGITAGIDDPDLREVIARAAAGAIARQWGRHDPSGP